MRSISGSSAPGDSDRRQALAPQGDARFEKFADHLQEILADGELFRNRFENAPTDDDCARPTD